jgi:hypothetical protein
MRTPVVVAVGSVTLAAVAIAVGCQTYDFEPVQPIAIAQTTASYSTIGRSLKPNMALLVDKSGSMNFAVNPIDPNCDVGGGTPSLCGQTGNPPCPTNCPTRWADLRTAMTQFLGNNGSVARLGLAFFPVAACAPTASMAQDVSNSNDVDSELQSWASQILGKINAITPAGGTPTAASITFVAGNQALADSQRDNFILLLTDGLPNCNVSFEPPYDVNNPTGGCKCTDTNVESCKASPRALCLDQSATVAAIQAAYAQHNIRTIVVGFGAETGADEGKDVLEAMAQAGQFPRTCPSGTNAECGTGSCDAANKTCTPGFYQATNAADLARVLANIAKKISQAPCDYLLDVTPSDPNFITVLVNDTVVARGPDTWIYLGPGGDGGTFGKVQLVGALCEQAKQATPDSPVEVEIRLLRTF